MRQLRRSRWRTLRPLGARMELGPLVGLHVIVSLWCMARRPSQDSLDVLDEVVKEPLRKTLRKRAGGKAREAGEKQLFRKPSQVPVMMYSTLWSVSRLTASLPAPQAGLEFSFTVLFAHPRTRAG